MQIMEIWAEEPFVKVQAGKLVFLLHFLGFFLVKVWKFQVHNCHQMQHQPSELSHVCDIRDA